MLAGAENRKLTDHDSDAEWIADDFERAMSTADGAYYLSGALERLQNHAQRDAPAISADAAERILHMCPAVRELLPSMFAEERRHDLSHVALDGVETLVRYWAEPPSVRAHWSRSRVYEAGLVVRWLRNEWHNMSIMSELGERARKRRALALGDRSRSGR